MIGIEELRHEASQELTRWQRHRFFVLIILVIVISMILVSISLSLYNSSGAAQVDLSLPSLQALRKQAAQDKTDATFSSNGTLDAKAFDSFDTLYSQHIKEVTSTDNYGSRPLSDESLQMLMTPEQAAQATQSN